MEILLEIVLPGSRQKKPERRYMDVISKDKKLVGVREEDAENRVKWGKMIHHGNH